MARFNCNLPAPGAHAAAGPHVAARALGALDGESDPEAPAGPGWYESSRELVRGLEVQENAPGDAALAEWIRACMGR